MRRAARARRARRRRAPRRPRRAGRRASRRGTPPRRRRARAWRRPAARAMPPQREIFRQTASATPAPSAPGSAAVSSIETRTATRSRTSRIACRPCVGSSTSSRPAGESASIVAHRLLDVPGAVGVEAQRHARPGGRARRGHAAGVVADADLQLHARRSPPAPPRAACSAAPARSSADSVALTGTCVAGSSLSSAATGLPARRPARSHSARSIAASAAGRSSTLPAGVDHLRAVHSAGLAPAPGGSSRVPARRARCSRRRRPRSGAASP